MKDKDFKTIIIFVLLIILIAILLSYNVIKKDINNNDVDRKVIYINNMTYDEVYNKSKIIFKDIMDILVKNSFDYEKNSNGKDKVYSINRTDYKKITNISILFSKIKEQDIDKFISYRNILIKDNNYYMLNDYNIETSYIGSHIKINGYTDDYINIKSIDYYCDDEEYMGIIDDEIICNNTKESNFKIVFINNELIFDNLEDLINIVQ